MTRTYRTHCADLVWALEKVTSQLESWLDGVEDADSADTDAISDAKMVLGEAKAKLKTKMDMVTNPALDALREDTPTVNHLTGEPMKHDR